MFPFTVVRAAVVSTVAHGEGRTGGDAERIGESRRALRAARRRLKFPNRLRSGTASPTADAPRTHGLFGGSANSEE